MKENKLYYLKRILWFIVRKLERQGIYTKKIDFTLYEPNFYTQHGLQITQEQIQYFTLFRTFSRKFRDKLRENRFIILEATVYRSIIRAKCQVEYSDRIFTNTAGFMTKDYLVDDITTFIVELPAPKIKRCLNS